MLKRITGWFVKLTPAAIAVLGLVLVGSVAAGGFYAYRTYTYIQHDNDFCLSCHLMQDPYERFAESAHRGLGCKACHQPTLTQRSTMALTQVLQNPDSILTHAEVPSERCAECHVEGDPEKWLLISQSAGHRVHLESSDSALSRLECVGCHSTTLHEFAASDRTCSQSGCHESTEIRLGGMGALTIHCATCHEFSAPAGGASTDSVSLVMRPQREECLSCHAMRQLATSFPAAADDPHGGSCGSCHQPHEQTTPAQAVETCATSGCHSSPEEITPFHRGLQELVLADCLVCHQAHAFHADEQCSECHSTVTQPGVVAAHAVPGAVPDARPFRHDQHADVVCASCHVSSDSHGEVVVSSYAQCQSCHHTGATVEPCAQCHAPETLAATGSVRRTLTFSVGTPKQRDLPFDHRVHTAVECSSCHEGGVERSAAATDCASCHVEHHEADNNCMACHAQPVESAHQLSAHLTCGGAGCHAPNPFDPVPRTRPFCLSCHQDLVDHRPDGDCAACHALPAGQAGGG